MRKKIFLILGIVMWTVCVMQAEQWKLHPTYANYLDRIIDTPKYTWVLSSNQQYVSFAEAFAMRTRSLFRYDKSSKETEWMSIQNKLSSPVVVAAEYNFEKGYMMVCYNDGDIDLLYDDGKVVNIPGLKVADASVSKGINSITFVPGSDEVYLGTGFGYITVNDKKGEIGTSRILDRSFDCAVKVGDKMVLGDAGGLYFVDLRGSDIAPVPGISEIKKFVVSGDKLYIEGRVPSGSAVSYISLSDPTLTVNPYFVAPVTELETAKDGILVNTLVEMFLLNKDGEVKRYSKPADTYGKRAGGYDGKNFWIDNGFKGVAKIQGNPEDSDWKNTGEVILPNASNTYKSPHITYSDRYGMLVRNPGIDYNFSNILPYPGDLISGLKGNLWTPYSTTVKLPDNNTFYVSNPNGVAIDPNDKDMVYCGSVLYGILRLNMADPSKSLRLGLHNDEAAGQPGFIGIVDAPSGIGLEHYSPFGPPAFDNNGYMWIPYFDINRNKEEIWYWSPEDRKATTSASNYRPLKKLEINNIIGSNASSILPLKHSANKNILVTAVGTANTLAVVNHNGTLDNSRDDKCYIFSKNLYDQDGSTYDVDYYRALYEDPATGNVWVGSDNGVFYFNPRELSGAGDSKVTRVKVARNDGTNYADFLLDGVSINQIASDNQGRKWFATKGGGITVTTSSGTQVVRTYTADNSELPSDIVYSVCYNPDNNSMMISTDAGLAELFLSGGPSGGGDDSDVTIYPNPVRPDYYGYVNIEGLEDGALVKITDSAGNIIKELGFADNGSIRWDVTNQNNKRVRSGVYYVLASGGPDSSGFSAAGKILVVN
ncbi:MAG: hypothetical protein K2L89_04680 [Muribaculaceae bacterium]|nr:hypothetical protein [Muribaculaceae bacterium]